MSAWAAVAVTGAANLAGLVILAWRTGRWTGDVNATLGELRRIGGDHETRLRVVEGHRRR